jgi:hypothetical protein
MSGFKVNFSVNNQLATPAIHAAALVNRPAAGQPGRVFIDTDNPSTGIYRDTGTAWIQIASTSSPEVDTLQTVTDRGNTTDNTLILTYDSLFNGSNQIEFFDVGTTAVRYSINKVGTGNRLTIQGNSPLSTFDMGLMIDAPNNTLRTYFGSSFDTKGISLDFTNNIYRLGNISGTAGQQGIYVNNIGNVGIGNTSPTAGPSRSLDIRGTSDTNGGTLYLINLSLTARGYVSMFNNTAGIVIGTETNHNLTLSTNGSTRATIFTNGNLAVGSNTDAGYRMDISGGNFRVQNGSSSWNLLGNTTIQNLKMGTGTSTFTGIDAGAAMFTGSSFRIRVDTSWTNFFYNAGVSENFYFGRSQSPAAQYKVDIEGDLRSTSNSYFATASGSVSIGTTTHAASAALQVVSTTKGFLPPVMTNAQMTAIASPATGLMVYDTTNSRLNVYDGSNWISLH